LELAEELAEELAGEAGELPKASGVFVPSHESLVDAPDRLFANVVRCHLESSRSPRNRAL